jgi:hypothetical protein
MSGMHSDNYEFARSSAPQSIKDYSAFTDKQWNYKQDSNGGVYQAQNSMVEFDLSSIYQSDGYSDVSDFYIVVPLVMVAQTHNAGTAVAPPLSGFSLCTLKNNYHILELVLNGKTIHDHQSFQNIYSNFKLISSMSPSDLKSNNTNFGMASDLDSNKSVRFGKAAPTAGVAGVGPAGYGIINNQPYSTSASYQQTVAQNNGKGNDALAQRINRIVDSTTNSSYNNLFGASATCIMTTDQLSKELKPYYTTNQNIMHWFDYGIINLKYILDAIAKIGLVKRADMRLRMYVNTGAVAVTVADPNATTTYYTAFTSSFSNTCPFTVNLISGLIANGGIGAGVTTITAGLYIAKPPSSFNGAGTYTISLANALPSPMTSCSLYYSTVKLDLQSESEYVNANRAKKVVFEKIYYANNMTIASGGMIDKTISNSIKNPIALVIVPFVSKAGSGGVLGTAPLNFAQYESPWDTAPSTNAPAAQ